MNQLFERIHKKSLLAELKAYYRELGFKTTIEDLGDSIIVNVNSDELSDIDFDFFNENHSGISFGIRNFNAGPDINFWAIRLADHNQGKGLARKLVEGFIKIIKPKRVFVEDKAQKGFCQWLERVYPDIEWIID